MSRVIAGFRAIFTNIKKFFNVSIGLSLDIIRALLSESDNFSMLKAHQTTTIAMDQDYRF